MQRDHAAGGAKPEAGPVAGAGAEASAGGGGSAAGHAGRQPNGAVIFERAAYRPRRDFKMVLAVLGL